MTSIPRHLLEHAQDLSIVRLKPGAIVDWPWRQGPFAAMMCTPTETSLVCLTELVPDGVPAEGPFRAVEVAGPLAFGAVGVFAELLAPMVEAGISVLAYSTFDTDYLLIRAELSAQAAQVWRRAGLILTPATFTGGPTSGVVQ